MALGWIGATMAVALQRLHMGGDFSAVAPMAANWTALLLPGLLPQPRLQFAFSERIFN
jgi:hypothetical protein